MSGDARRLLRWVTDSGDAGGRAFFIIDKRNALLYVFEPEGPLRAHTAILLGGAPGDHTVPGIGDRPIADVLPHERTTPAGRFIGERGRNMRGEDVVWVDYDAAVSVHRVLTSHPAERRLERLASPTPLDNRISYGCINVPAAFFDTHVMPIVVSAGVIVYILPEVRTLAEVFGIPAREARDMAEAERRHSARAAAFMDPWSVEWTFAPRARRN
jgi:hypothetical protein